MKGEVNVTIADVVAAMRKAGRPDDIFGNGEQFGTPCITGNDILDWADVLEAVVKRAHNEIDDEVRGIDGARSEDIRYVRLVMNKTLGDYYE